MPMYTKMKFLVTANMRKCKVRLALNIALYVVRALKAFGVALNDPAPRDIDKDV